MAVLVVLPAALREYARGASEVRASGGTLDALLSNLDAKFPGIRQRVLQDTGVLREYVNVFVNGDQVEQADPRRVRVADGDTVHIIPSIAGGAR
ncbi:MAG: MoaD/ThiS family protein [Methanobacteriota archaeon]|nr:MAG: MoaD/ThiS family protein [Euryarchaeota archaeon]